MNSDSESLHNLMLACLLADAQTKRYAAVKCEDTNGAENPLQKTTTLTKNGNRESGSKPHNFLLGEIPTVQERFQAVLKRRLQVQIEDNPPLFPWETQLNEYPESIDNRSVALVPTWGWAAQQSKLNLPIVLPEEIFQHLLDKCQALATSALPLGAKLVQAVESLFPNHSQGVNDLAGLVLMSPCRSVDALDMPNLDSDYSDLQTRQQMALSLLAAKQLLEDLTLPISLSNPVLERQWLTSLGVLDLKVQYQFLGQMTKLRVQSKLPCKGVLKLQGEDGSQVKAESSTPGSLSVELRCTQLNQTYTLAVELKEMDQPPLSFVIIPT